MHRVRLVLAGAAAVGTGFAWASIGGASPGAEPEGDRSGEEYLASLPDRMPVTARDSLMQVGTINKEAYLELRLGDQTPPGETRPTPEPLEVLDADGDLVGHYHLGIGFVSLEESSAPGFDAAKLVAPTTTISEP